MKFSKEKVYVIFIALFSFVFNCNVEAYVLKNYGVSSSGNPITGGSSGCAIASGCRACSSTNPEGYRFTLVDKYGNKVAGTRSVDYTGGNSYNQNGIDTFVNTSGTKYSLVNGDKYLYKFSDINDSKKYNNRDDFLYVTIPNGPVDGSTDDFISTVVSKEKKWKIYLSESDEKGDDVDFFTLFLHTSGFLDDSDYQLSKFPDKAREIAYNDYYIIMEPAYFIYDNNCNGASAGFVNYRYGTATEFASTMKQGSFNYSEVLDLGQLSQLNNYACDEYTPKGSGVSTITNDTTFCPARWVGRSYYKIVKNNVLDKVLDTSYGYGVRVISVNENPEIETTIKSFNLNICSASTNVNGSDGLVSFGIYNGNVLNFMKSESELKQSYFKVTDGVFCYDSVSYDFSNTISSLSKSRQQYTTLNIPSGIANVNRVCYVNNAYPYTAENVKNDISSYTDSNSNISLNLYGKKYDFRGALIGDIGDTTIYGGMDFFVHRYTFNIKYTVENSIKIGKDTVGSYDNSISFSNTQNLFGKSSTLVRNLLYTNKMPYILDINNEDRLVKEGTTSHFTCDFKSVVEEAPAPNEGGENGSINFRTISLDNPFPARDGTERLPGLNWLNKNNYVFDYITNNRGIRSVMNSDDVSPEAMYDNVEPMYTVVLDPSTMLAIRKYNKGRSYDDMLSGSLRYDSESMRCNNGRECFSTFLRNPDFIPVENLSGTCALANTGSISPRVIRCEFDKVKFDELFTKNEDYKGVEYTLDKIRATVYDESVGYNPAYDFNNNHRNDTDDVEIFSNKDKYTQFYTCANKSYKSGGPTEGGSE